MEKNWMNGGAKRIKEKKRQGVFQPVSFSPLAKNIKKPFRFSIHNEPGIESSAWYQKHMKQ